MTIYYCDDCNNRFEGSNNEQNCPKCGSGNICA